MTNVGRAFGFYIKHWQQMEALYGSEESERKPLLQKLSEERRNMIEAIGVRADEQAAELMKEIGKELRRFFGKDCRTEVRVRRGIYRKAWLVDLRLWLKGKPRPRRSRWIAGAYIESNEQYKSPVVFLYFWVRGGEGGEEKLGRFLGKLRDKYRWGEGSVAFDVIPIRFENNHKFYIEKEALIKKTTGALKKIRKKDIERLFSI
jgi:hypothetical protein